MLQFPFPLFDILNFIGGAVIAIAILYTLWGISIYISANRSEIEWDHGRASLVAGTVFLSVIFCLWLLFHSLIAGIVLAVAYLLIWWWYKTYP